MLGAEKIFSFVEQDDTLIKKYEQILKEKREKLKLSNKPKTPNDKISTGDICIFLDETVQAPGLLKVFRPNGYLSLFQVIKKNKLASTLEIQSLRTGQIHSTDLRKIRKLNINEFISELSAQKYFRNLPDFSKFTKKGDLETDSPLFDCDYVEPLKTENFPDIPFNLQKLKSEIDSPISSDILTPNIDSNIPKNKPYHDPDRILDPNLNPKCTQPTTDNLTTKKKTNQDKMINPELYLGPNTSDKRTLNLHSRKVHFSD